MTGHMKRDPVIWIVIIDIKGLSQGFEDIN